MLAHTARILLASLGAYALAVAAASLLARTLPIARIEATFTATMLAIPVMVGAAILAYGCRHARDAALWIIGGVLVLGGVAWMVPA